MLWTTRYIDATVAQLRAEAHEIRDEDIVRLSPLKHRNLNVLGRCSFSASVPREGLRHLRNRTRSSWTMMTTAERNEPGRSGGPAVNCRVRGPHSPAGWTAPWGTVSRCSPGPHRPGCSCSAGCRE
ncbi:transposase [Streptomyces sp. NBC_01546]|nr:transposase [Streptomyces sp. NBC_00047]